MGSYKRHIKVDHNGDLEHIKASRKDLRELRENRGDDLTVDDLAKFIDRHLSGMEGHQSMMSQEADNLYDEIRPQGHLIAPLVANQPFLDRPAGTGKAAGGDDLSKLVPDGIRAVIPAAPVAERVYGTDGLTMVPRAGQPPISAGRANVPLEFQKFVSVEDED
jgi:hypothetical protein